MWRFTLAREIAISQAATERLRHNGSEAFCIRHLAFALLAMVVAKNLLIHIARKVKRLYGNVGATQRSLEKRPEIFHAVDVDLSANVSLSLIHHVMHETSLHSIVVGDRVIRVHRAPELHVLKNRVLQSLAGDVRHNCGANLAKIPVKDSLCLGSA